MDTEVDTTTKSMLDFPASLRGKRILLATESHGPINGVSRTTGSLIEYLRSNGVEVAVIAPEIDASKIKTSQLAQATLRLPGWPLPYNPDLAVAYPFRLTKLFDHTFVPDVIYLASPASVGFQILLSSRRLRKSPPILCNFQTDLSSYSEIIFPAGMDTFAVWLLGVVQGYLFNGPGVHTVFYPCSEIRRYLERTSVQSNRLVHLGRGVDTVTFDPARRDEAYRAELAPNGEIILICVSRLASEKGFDFLAQAAIELAKTIVPFKLVIVGGNRNSTVEMELRQYFDPVKQHVVFTGFLTGNSLARAYAAADVFLHCSITETFGLVVLESMASGVPVVARDQGGPSEIVRHNKTGYLVPPSDLQQFVENTKTLCIDVHLRSAFSTASRQVALDTTWEKINNKAAWHISSALQQHDRLERSTVMAHASQPLVKRLYRAVCERTVDPIREYIRLQAAVAIVSGFWLIACIPLILHGTLVFRQR